MGRELSGKYCTAGTAEAPSGEVKDGGHWELNLIACKRAIEDCGIEEREIDFVVTSGSMVVNRPRHHVVLCEQPGLPLAKFTEPVGLVFQETGSYGRLPGFKVLSRGAESVQPWEE